MKINNKVMCLAVLTSFFVSPLAVHSIEDTAVQASEDASSEDASMEVSGKVVSVDAEQQQVVIEYQLDAEETVISIFNLSETMEISKGGEMMTVSELTEGDQVTVTYDVDENDNKVIKTLVLEN